MFPDSPAGSRPAGQNSPCPTLPYSEETKIIPILGGFAPRIREDMGLIELEVLIELQEDQGNSGEDSGESIDNTWRYTRVSNEEVPFILHIGT